MSSIKINGGKTLSGEVTVQGSKNAFHKILGACVRWPGVFRLENVPDIQDAAWLLDLFRYIGGIVSKGNGTTLLDSRDIRPRVINHELADKSSGTFLFAGALLARFGRVEIAPPGGDKIGFRPVGYHLEAFSAMGANVIEKNGRYLITGEHLRDGKFNFPGQTVNGTVNAILAASATPKGFRLEGCAIETDVLDAITFLQELGARINVIDLEQGIIEIMPSKVKTELGYQINPDRNATATYALAGALVGQGLTLKNVNISDTQLLWDFLVQVGVKVELDNANSIASVSHGKRLPYNDVLEGSRPPGFSTDWAPMVQVLLTQLPKSTEYHENVFSNRFAHIPELVKMGAHAELHETESGQWVEADAFSPKANYDRCRFAGKAELHGTDVYANDVRSGAALVLAGLVAKGQTTVYNAIHVERGYEDIVSNLNSLGAEAEWTTD